MRILVTGASGFLGRNLVRTLLSERNDVVVLVRRSSDIEELKQLDLDYVYGDLRDEGIIAKMVQGVDAVVHAAATMRGAWDQYYQVNVRSTELLLEACRQNNTKAFIFISSVISYDHSKARAGTSFPEDHEYEKDNLNPYSRSKIESERLVMKYHREHNLNTVILRPAALYGPGGPIYPARLGFSLTANLYLLIGNGRQPLPLSHVESVATAIRICLDQGSSSGAIYNITEDGRITRKEFLRLVKNKLNPRLTVVRLPYHLALPLAIVIARCLKWLGKTSPIRIPYLRLCSTAFYYPNEKAKNELGWKPQDDLHASIDATLSERASRRKPSRIVPLKKSKVIVPTDRKLRVVIVGCGRFAATHLSILKKFKNANVVALCDPDENARKTLATRFGISQAVSSLKEVLSHQPVDLVHIVTPAQTHFTLAQEAIANKCHVLIEKPMTLNAQEAKTLIRLAKENGVKICVDHNHLYDAVMIKAREILASGSLGRISYVESWYGASYSTNKGSPYLKHEARRHWVYTEPGSLYQNLISHPISVLTDVLGTVLEIKAFTEYMHVVPHMRSDELRVLVRGERMIGSIHLTLAVSPRYHYLNIYGTRGSLRIDFLNKLLFLDRVVPVVPKVVSRNVMSLKHSLLLSLSTVRNGLNVIRGRYSLFEGNERLIHLFYRSVLLDEPEPVSAEESVHSMEIMDRIWEQIDIGDEQEEKTHADVQGIHN